MTQDFPASISPWTRRDKIRRVAWGFAYTFLFRPSFHNLYAFRALLLRCFGAKLGRNVRVRRTARIEVPWNIELGDEVSVGDHAILYSLGKIRIGPYSSVSQYAHLCAGTHDHTTRAYTLLRLPINVGSDVWIAADAFVGPDVTIGDRALVAARATVVADVPAGKVVAGCPARVIKDRVLLDDALGKQDAPGEQDAPGKPGG